MPAEGVFTWLGILVLVTSACQGPDDSPSAEPSAAGDVSVAGPDSPPPTAGEISDCPGLAVVMVDGLQRYVDSFGEVTGPEIADLALERQDDLDQLTTEVRAKAEELGCAAPTMTPLLEQELRRLHGDGPIQTAIANTFRSDPLGTIDPADPGPTTRSVSTSEELEAALITLGSGSTLQLEGGDFEVDEPLVIQRPLTIVGAGRSRTTLRSSAPGAALVLVSDGNVRLADLGIAHVGAEPSSIVVVTAGGYEFADVLIQGAIADEDGAGGFGVVLRADSPLLASGTRQVIRDSSLRDNDSGGIVVAGSEAPIISSVRVSGTSGCGVCWAESAKGTISDSTIVGVETGVRIEGQAAPIILGTTIRSADTGVAILGSGNPVLRHANLFGNGIGVSIAGSGRASIVDNLISDSRLGIQVSGTSMAVLEDNEVAGGGDAGIAVIERAAPALRGVLIAMDGEVGMLWADHAGGRAADVVVRGPRVGIQLSDDAAPLLSGVVVEDVGEVALFSAGRSGGDVRDLRCDDTDSALVLLLERTAVEVDGSENCRVVDERDAPA